MVQQFEFYIASSSCRPGTMKGNANICLDNFSDACKFAMCLNPGCVLWHGWQMYVWHYKVVDDHVTLLNTFDMNDYVAGTIDYKGYFHPVDNDNKNNKDDNEKKFSRENCELYHREVIYREPHNPIIIDNSEIRKIYRSKVVSVTLPGETQPAKFSFGCGYRFDLFHWRCQILIVCLLFT